MGAFPTVVVIGASGAATAALGRCLSAHPEVAVGRRDGMSFFTDDWHRGFGWYAEEFEAGCPVRVECSPSYTDPAHPEAADRMARVIPEARLVYLVRDPVDRAMAQWHEAHLTGEDRRRAARALPDPDGPYLARSRYAARLAPYLKRFPRSSLLVLVQERLVANPGPELERLRSHVGAGAGELALADAGVVDDDPPTEHVPGRVRRAVWQRLGDDVDALRELLDDPIPEWRDPR